MNWRVAIRDNWAYKIAAILIVALLWVNLTAEERQAQEVATLVEYEIGDSAWVLVEGPREVRTTFQGRNRALLGLLVNEPIIRVPVPEVTAATMLITLTTDMVSYDTDLAVRPTLVMPMSVELGFEPMTERNAPVAPDLETIPALGYTVVRPLIVEPESVTVRGAASQVEQVAVVATRRVTLDDLEHTIVRDLPLRLPAGVDDVVLEPPSVLVTVPVDSLVVRQMVLPVVAVGQGASAASVTPDSVTATLRGGWSAVQRQLESLTRAVVQVVERPRGTSVLPVGVELVEGEFVSVSLDPSDVTVGRRR